MKLNVAVCDADIHAQVLICGAVQTVLQDMGFAANVTRFSCGEALLQELEHQDFHIVTLAIDLPDIDGIAVGRRLRTCNNPPQLIYISEREDRVFDALLNRPVGFVRKGRFLNDLVSVLELLTAPTPVENTQVTFATRQSTICMEAEDIRYIEGCRNYQLIHLKDSSGPVEIKMTMDRVESILAGFGFVRIHRGYLVNYLCIRNISYDHILLTDGSRLPVGQSKVRSLRQQYAVLQNA